MPYGIATAQEGNPIWGKLFKKGYPLDPFPNFTLADSRGRSLRPGLGTSTSGCWKSTDDLFLMLLLQSRAGKIQFQLLSVAVWDNIFAERLWRSLKYEEAYLKSYQTVREAREGLASYFHFYNNQRLHQALGYQTPRKVYLERQGEPIPVQANPLHLKEACFFVFIMGRGSS